MLKYFSAVQTRWRIQADLNQGGLAGPIIPGVVPGSDGAGVVKSVGTSVTAFRPGDRVITHLAPKLVESAGDDALPNLAGHPVTGGTGDIAAGLGQQVDGTLRSEGVFHETALALAPGSLDWPQAATLTCSGLTAWNSLFGLKEKAPGPGSWVLVQGTGGVSVAALQFAVAVGANVVATTSTDDKAKRLRELGAKHTVNYRTNPDGWGKEARSFTPGSRGFDMVVDIAGDATLSQSLAAVRVEGVVVSAGFVGGEAKPVPLTATVLYVCTARGVILGSKRQLKDMVRFIDEKGVVPAVDDVVFGLDKVKEAYQRMEEQKHFSKVVIRINH